MLGQFVSALPGTLTPVLLFVTLSVLLTITEAHDRPRSDRWRWYGVALGIVASVVFATCRALSVVSQRTFINLPTLWFCVVVDVLAFVMLLAVRWCNDLNRPRIHDAANVVAALALFGTTFRNLPDVILQLTNFIRVGEPIFTSDMLLRAIGFVLGVGSAIVIGLIVRSSRMTASSWSFHIAGLALIAIIATQHIVNLIQILYTNVVIDLSDDEFTLLVWFINHDPVLQILQIGVFLLPAIASIVAGFRANVHLDSSAESRLARAFRRRAVVRSFGIILSFVVVLCTLTFGLAEVNRGPILSAPEPYTITKNIATIPISHVSDGHLHRFSYTAKDGTPMRFIIIQKRGGAYGVGLDACENCGDAGYYEDGNGKIICKRCGVAINIATIGFKGGCNPIPFPYKITHGTIQIHTADLDALSKKFSK